MKLIGRTPHEIGEPRFATVDHEALGIADDLGALTTGPACLPSTRLREWHERVDAIDESLDLRGRDLGGRVGPGRQRALGADPTVGSAGAGMDAEADEL
ncbi:hypothetical protein [Methylobacterium tardum]|uniref:hypothetical protein n=1 Tax=Methylobacterium tardum TaxID=374432 RepID=UPI0036100241